MYDREFIEHVTSYANWLERDDVQLVVWHDDRFVYVDEMNGRYMDTETQMTTIGQRLNVICASIVAATAVLLVLALCVIVLALTAYLVWWVVTWLT